MDMVVKVFGWWRCRSGRWWLLSNNTTDTERETTQVGKKAPKMSDRSCVGDLLLVVDTVTSVSGRTVEELCWGVLVRVVCLRSEN